jgi:peptidoglycan/xylan/chitin deacetylase (PgdA/CDA1 family)
MGADGGRELHVVMYHYVRDLPRTRFPEIKGMLTSAFRRQVHELASSYEMATLESGLAFLAGEYRPSGDLCLLTFDDGLREHWTDVFPILKETGIQGVFLLPTVSIEERRVLPVHQNHFLLAGLGFPEFQRRFLQRWEASEGAVPPVDAEAVRKTYRWDTAEVAAFKYLLNFGIPADRRDLILAALFEEHLGDQVAFSRELYLSWDEAREMQSGGMVMGGHGHTHAPLSPMGEERQRADLACCAELLLRRLSPQPRWPFSFPYGKRDSYDATTIETLRALGFACAFATDVGSNAAGQDRFALRRIDPKDVHAAAA